MHGDDMDCSLAQVGQPSVSHCPRSGPVPSGSRPPSSSPPGSRPQIFMHSITRSRPGQPTTSDGRLRRAALLIGSDKITGAARYGRHGVLYAIDRLGAEGDGAATEADPGERLAVVADRNHLLHILDRCIDAEGQAGRAVRHIRYAGVVPSIPELFCL